MPRGATYTPAQLLEAADHTERQSHQLMATAIALRNVHHRLHCPTCTPTIEIPIDHDGSLQTSLAYCTHELTCRGAG